tara:strand:- start:2058 stop:2591 length:534 start_codon:yes stop_codon:yes gene_type:complete
MIDLLLALLLGAADGAPQTEVPDRLDNGRWVERRIDGGSDCDNSDARALTLIYLDEPPHPRSSNIGEVTFSLGDTRAHYVLTGVSLDGAGDPGGDRLVHLHGGITHTVGVERQGVTSAFLRGRMTARLRQDASGDLHLEAVRFEQRGHEAESLVDDGRLAGFDNAEALRAMSYCPSD